MFTAYSSVQSHTMRLHFQRMSACISEDEPGIIIPRILNCFHNRILISMVSRKAEGWMSIPPVAIRCGCLFVLPYIHSCRGFNRIRTSTPASTKSSIFPSVSVRMEHKFPSGLMRHPNSLSLGKNSFLISRKNTLFLTRYLGHEQSHHVLLNPL